MSTVSVLVTLFSVLILLNVGERNTKLVNHI